MAEHPHYKALYQGFPKGYMLLLNSHYYVNEYRNGTFEIFDGDEISFSIVLIGSFIEFDSLFIEAVMQMCKRGFGSPMVGFTIESLSKELFPVMEDEIMVEINKLKVCFITPTQLYRVVGKKDGTPSYQDKMNGFPSFIS